MRSVQDEGTKVSSRRHPPAAQNIDLEAGALAAKLLYTASARDIAIWLTERSEIRLPLGHPERESIARLALRSNASRVCDWQTKDHPEGDLAS